MKNKVFGGFLSVFFSILILFAISPAGVFGEDPIPFEPDDTLEEIRYKIDANGYNFTVSDNRVFRMPPEQRKRFFSRRFPLQPQYRSASDDPGPLIRHLDRRALPSSFDWRNYNGHSYISAIRDQGDCGACYAFGACSAAEGVYNYTNGLYSLSNRADYSESYIAWCLGRLTEYSSHFFGCDGSDYDYFELTALTVEGVVDESDFPYTETDPGSCSHWDDPTTRFLSWHRIPCNDIEAIKTAIVTYGPVVAAVNVTSAFRAYDNGVFDDTQHTCPGTPCYYTETDHIVSLVGWNDAGGYWILRNCWGTGWGESGYMRISYRAARVACETAYLVYAPGRMVSGGDYNGDGHDDIAVFRPDTGLWAVRNLTRLYFGGRSDQPVSADFNGDGTDEIAVFRPTTGLWAYKTPFTTGRLYFGSLQDKPVPSDYNGDGTAEVAVFRPATGLWAIQNVGRYYFGTSGDIPVPSDYDGNGTAEIVIFRPATGLWAQRSGFRTYFGSAGDLPYALDPYNAGAGIGIFRPSTGLWAISGYSRFYFGGGSDQVAPADYSGGAGDEIAIFRASSGLWAIRGGNRYYYGTGGDIPATR